MATISKGSLAALLTAGVVLGISVAGLIRSDNPLTGTAGTVCFDEQQRPYSVGALRQVNGELERCNEDGRFGAPVPTGQGVPDR